MCALVGGAGAGAVGASGTDAVLIFSSMRVTPHAAGRGGRLLASAVLGGLLAACGSGRPPLLDDTQSSTGNVGGDAPSFGDATPTGPQSCDEGPSHGVCGCLDLTVLTDVPNLYFVLDRSGSMQDGNKWNKVRTVVGHTITRL